MRSTKDLVVVVVLLIMLNFSLVASFASRRLVQVQRRPPLRDFFTTRLQAKPKRGAVVESYRTVSVNCAKCRERLFRYKKKNGTKSNLIKCYIERIAEDSAGVLQKAQEEDNIRIGIPGPGQQQQLLPQDYAWKCPNCQTQFARSAQIHGLPALKMVGGKVTMTKK